MRDTTARYMLVKIENELRGKKRLPTVNYDHATLEHILPKNPEQWDLSQVQLDAHSIDHARLGNLTLLTSNSNSALSNRPFDEKRAWYSEDGLEINKSVLAADSWDGTTIGERQDELAQIATRVWPRD